MAGQAGENSVADAAGAGNLAGPGGVWEQLALRLQAIPDYVELFKAAFGDIDVATDISFVHAANAMAAFEAVQWRADNSPFDRYLRGEKDAMSKAALSGMKLFYGAAKCATCHSGTFQTDQEFHAIAMAQIGPGKGDGPSGREDFGLARESNAPGDRFKFRTPTLRNTALTGPWGHAGAYNSLEAVVRHHLDPVASLMNYDRAHAVLPSRPDLDALDFVVQDDPALIAAIAEANELEPLDLDDREVKNIIEYLHTLTDPASVDLRVDVPTSVPSELPIFE
jgi:cytochrome c peroxidase